MNWINKTGPLGDVVLSSRIRLARNLSDTHFPPIMDRVMTETIMHRVHRSISGEDSPLKGQYQFLIMGDLAPVDREVLVEKHLASPDLLENAERSAILVNEQEVCSIMINEEDHIRMQCIFPGFQLKEAYDYLNKVDDAIGKELPYAFDEDLGYLTCCPTNLGTGMRASVMVHLPVLAATGQMKAILQTLPKVGIAVRGLYGEGSEAIGDIYQISNQITLGVTEDEIIANLEVVTKQVVRKEQEVRQAITKKNMIQFEDSIWRAYGIMVNARIMELNEFMGLLSKVRLGVEMGIISGVDIRAINELMVLGQPAHLKKYEDGDTAHKDLDEVRARAIAKKLATS